MPYAEIFLRNVIMKPASNTVLHEGWRPAKLKPHNHGRLFLVPARLIRPKQEVSMLKRIGLTVVAAALVWLVLWA